jgi:hypothetical protein
MSSRRPQPMICRECGEPAVHKQPRSQVPWKAHGLKCPEWSHRDGTPLCPVMGQGGYEPSQPVPARHARTVRAVTAGRRVIRVIGVAVKAEMVIWPALVTCAVAVLHAHLSRQVLELWWLTLAAGACLVIEVIAGIRRRRAGRHVHLAASSERIAPVPALVSGGRLLRRT